MLEHLLNQCERINLTRYLCQTCQHKEDNEAAIIRHCVKAAKRDPHHILGIGTYELPAKIGLGCPHCEKYFHTAKYKRFEDCVRAFHRCVVSHAKNKKTAGKGSFSKRVRASIQDDIVIRTTSGPCSVLQLVEDQCERWSLPRHAWKEFEWDDVNGEWFFDRLEHGQYDEADPMREYGFWEVEDFFSGLVQRAVCPSHEDATRDALLSSMQGHDPVSLAMSPGRLATQPEVYREAHNTHQAAFASSSKQDAVPGYTYPDYSNGYLQPQTISTPVGSWNAVIVAPSTAAHKKRKRGPSDTSQRTTTGLTISAKPDSNKPLPPLPSYDWDTWDTFPVIDHGPQAHDVTSYQPCTLSEWFPEELMDDPLTPNGGF